jgi:kynurenine/2-aminoadipate aminotransferase
MLATFSAVAGRAKPRVLYVIPTGQNPAGCTINLQRKKEIYALACKHNLIILEDDPYYFLVSRPFCSLFSRSPANYGCVFRLPELMHVMCWLFCVFPFVLQSYGRAAAPAVGSDGNWQRPSVPSFFSLDVEGRVLRFDSFSKILSSGLRLGMVSGPTGFVQRIDLVSQATALHTSGVSQALVSKLLKHWGENGWNEHIRQVCLFYARRRDAFIARIEKHLKGLVSYTVPEAGMFVYFKCHGIANTKPMVEVRGKEAKVLLVPGQAFSPNDVPSDCVRASFSTASDEEMDQALERFARMLREEAKQQQQPKSKL